MVEISSFYFWAYQISKDSKSFPLWKIQKFLKTFQNLPKWQKSPNSTKTLKVSCKVGQLYIKGYYYHFPKLNHFCIFQNDNTSWTSFSTHWNDNFERNWDMRDGPSDSLTYQEVSKRSNHSSRVFAWEFLGHNRLGCIWMAYNINNESWKWLTSKEPC